MDHFDGHLVLNRDLAMTGSKEPVVTVSPVVGAFGRVTLEDVLVLVVRVLDNPGLISTVERVLGNAVGCDWASDSCCLFRGSIRCWGGCVCFDHDSLVVYKI